MLILGLDTATEFVAAAVVDVSVGKILGRGGHRGRVAHAEQLAPIVSRALHEARARPADLDAIGVGRGPGPFTGLRVGLAHAAVMGWALRIPAHGVCTLDILAEQARRAGLVGPFLVVTDARRREVYWAAYDGAGACVEGPQVCPASEVPLRDLPTVGAGAAAYETEFVHHRMPLYPDPAVLAEMVAGRVRAGKQADLTPLYLRRPDVTAGGGRKRVTPR